MPTLYLMLGYPGAGKTTTAHVIRELTGAVHLASDRIRLEMFPKPEFTPEEHSKLYKAIDKKTEELLASGRDVIYDANLNRYIHRQQKYDICARTNSKFVLVWLRTEEELARHRATVLRVHDDAHPFDNLDEDVFDRLAKEIEPPQDNEIYVELDGTRITKDYVKEKLGL